MKNYKQNILNNICYTDLVYERINKKLNIGLTNQEIEVLIKEIIMETNESFIEKIGKNFYISNFDRQVKLTINSNTYRITTANNLKTKTTNR